MQSKPFYSNFSPTRLVVSFIITAMCFSHSQAHDDASDPSFCPDGVIRTMSKIKIKGNILAKLLEDGTVNCPVGMKRADNDELGLYVGQVMTNNNPYAKHDVFDELSRLAYSYASCMCASMVNQGVDLTLIRPLLIAPASLVNDDHHTAFKLTEGMIFSCKICVR